ncbi:MAG TPA: 50S ribosomal protein L15 [Devosia sp.]|nr:50S ribosomal protein L15 [Devosia sp.]
MRLNELKDNEGATRARTRVGRGIGSGVGKTAGRGVKGQKSRSGVAIKGFEGGQMPLHMRMPKRGFNNPFAKKFNTVRLDRIQDAIDAGRLDAKGVIDAAALVKARVIRRELDGVRLVNGHAEFKASKVTFRVSHASAGARKAVEAKGGKIDTPIAKAEQDA